MTPIIVPVVIHVFGGCIQHEQPHTAFGEHGQSTALFGQIRPKVKAVRVVDDDASNAFPVGRHIHVDFRSPVSKMGVLHQVGQPLVNGQLHQLDLVPIERWREHAAVLPMVEQGVDLVNDALQVSELLAGRIHLNGFKSGLEGLLDGFASSVEGGELAEDLVGPRQLHHYLNWTGNGGKYHLAIQRRNLPIERENGSESCGIKDSRLGEIEYEVADARADLLLAGCFEIGRVPEVQSFADVYDDGLLVPGFHREVH